MLRRRLVDDDKKVKEGLERSLELESSGETSSYDVILPPARLFVPRFCKQKIEPIGGILGFERSSKQFLLCFTLERDRSKIKQISGQNY